MAADASLEHGHIAVQPSSVPRRREVVQPCHELCPPPGISAGELRDTGKQLMKRKRNLAAKEAKQEKR